MILLLSIFSSCSNVRDINSIPNLKHSNCYTQKDYSYTASDLPQKSQIQNLDTTLINHFSFAAINIANAIGLLDMLKEYNLLNIQNTLSSSIEKRLKLLELRQTIMQKINTASLEISAVTSEMDCEEERANQIANYLKGKIDQKERNLVIGSIVVGAIGAITSEGLNNNPLSGKSGSYVSVGTALVEATLGVLILINKKSIMFYHERNTPAEIWVGPEISKTLPPPIWYYLNYKDEVNRKKSLRELLVEHWENFGQINKFKKKSKKTSLEIYFTKGGKYTSDQLQNRADMYDQIESYINLMKQDLNILSSEFEKLSIK
ncbi:MAG: hypothetical protein J5I91_03740 [Bacteroidetes bacterium]|nr:hypothetical protein [Bacteroidota bacterium]